jgi:hypothetical protein
MLNAYAIKRNRNTARASTPSCVESEMKLTTRAMLFGLLLLSSLVGVELQAQSLDRPVREQQTAATGTTLTFKNDRGDNVISLEYLITGGPASSSIVLSGCAVGGTCDVLETYTGNANSIRNPVTSKVYDSFTVAVTLTGGTNPRLTVNRVTVRAGASGSSINASTAGQGYFFGGTVFAPTRAPISVVWTPANEVRVWQFVLPFATTVRKFSVRVGTLSAGGTFGAGIYDATGSRLWWGTVSTAATGDVTSTTTGGDTYLPPGVYYYAWTNDNVVAAFQNFQEQPVFSALMNKSGNSFGAAANASVAGVLPTTLGVITPSSLSFSPVVVAFAP